MILHPNGPKSNNSSTKTNRKIYNRATRKKLMKTKNKRRDRIVRCFNVLHDYNLHSMAYSKSKNIRNKLRNRLFQENIDTFLLTNIENDILQNVNNEDVTETLAHSNMMINIKILLELFAIIAPSVQTFCLKSAKRN